MLQIFICEDNKTQREEIKSFIKLCLEKNNLDIPIALSVDNPSSLLEYSNILGNTGIYFLDIDLKEKINGIQLAEKIREIDPLGYIIFVTSHVEFSFMVFEYKVEALDYIIKNDDKNLGDKIEACILKALKSYESLSKADNILKIKSSNSIECINLDNVIFFETTQAVHKILVHQANRQFEFYGSLKDIEDKLPGNFYRCHKSYILNKNKIAEINMIKGIAHMINNEECYISHRHMKGLLKEWK